MGPSYTHPTLLTLIPTFIQSSHPSYTHPTLYTLIPPFIHLSHPSYTHPTLHTLIPPFIHSSHPTYTSNNLLFSLTRSFTSSSHHALPFFFLPTHLYPQTIPAHLTTVLLNFSHSSSTSRTLPH